MLDCVVLTDPRYLDPPEVDWYVQQVLDEDGAVIDALRAQGLTAGRLSWDDPRVLSGGHRSLIFRSTWDYFERWPAFSAWLDTVSTATPLFNPAPLVRWNLDKHYLQELDDQGVSVVPTRWVPRGSADLARLVREAGWGEVVVKPAISGAGRDTFRVHLPDPEGVARFDALVAAEDVLLQPFLPAILDRGEVSVIVIDGEVTHAVRKVAAAGEFRVQDDHGGTVQAHAPTDAEARLALDAVAACDPMPLYARVDMVDLDGGPAIMELELVEPELFFRFGPDAAPRLARAIARHLATSG